MSLAKSQKSGSGNAWKNKGKKRDWHWENKFIFDDIYKIFYSNVEFMDS